MDTATTDENAMETSGKISVLIVDDHPVVIKGIRSYLHDNPRIEILGEAFAGDEAVEKALALRPDVVLMDFNMPGLDGAEAIHSMREAKCEARILVFTMFDERNVVLKIIQAGAQGYLLKSAFHKELLNAIETVYRGDIYLGADIAKILLSEYLKKSKGPKSKPKPQRITLREKQVLAFIAEGLRNKDIADRLNVSVRTIEAHRDRIRKKLGISSPAGLTKYAIDHGIARKKQQ